MLVTVEYVDQNNVSIWKLLSKHCVFNYFLIFATKLLLSVNIRFGTAVLQSVQVSSSHHTKRAIIKMVCSTA